ncbi:MAG: S41 family peptidase [candidate division WOR-3 bacterium]|nr:S41 family peptidase [candidate division WOR-3 bacterium]
MFLFLIFTFFFTTPKYNIRYPSLSPDGKKITFSCFGDMWMVKREGGRATRLTISDGYESISRWSADGRWIAYQSDKWGNDDIFVVPTSESLPPQRLTYYSTYDHLLCWTPDSKKILFSSSRNTLFSAIYSVSLEGETPKKFLDFDLINIDFISRDSILYSRGATSWWRKKYRGPANREIWIKELPDGKSKKITNFDGRDAYPMFSPVTGRIYFLSNRGKNNIDNIWKLTLDGSKCTQVTEFKEEILHPSISQNGEAIVFTSMGWLYALDVRTEKVERVPLKIPLAYKEPKKEFKEFSSEVSEFCLSPDEKEITFVIHGEVFVGKLTENGKIEKIRQITHTPSPEKDVSWHPEKERLIFSSLRDGDFDIYIIEPDKKEKFYEDFLFKTKKILDTDKTEYKPLYSPDGKKIAFLQGSGKLWVMDKNGNSRKALTEENDVKWADWSPDSRWATFSRTALEWREDVFVVPVDGSRMPINISTHPNDDYKPMWSNDGRRIAFASRDNIGNLWIKYVFLYKEDEDKGRDYWEKNLDSLKSPEKIQIDFNRIEDRIHTITMFRGEYNYIAQSPRGDRFAIQAENLNSNDVWTIDWFGDELKRLTTSNVTPKEIVVSRDGKKVYYLSKRGNIGLVSIKDAKPENLSFRIEMAIDFEKERMETFKQAWWVLQDGFYDSNFHGVDWKKMREKYIDLAKVSRAKSSFYSAIEMMIGELNASHLGVWGSRVNQEVTGRLGIIPDPDYKGEGVRIKSVIPESPATREDVSLKPGEIITAINGEKIGGKNFYRFLRRTANKEIFVTTNKKEVSVKPLTPQAILHLIEKDWINRNRKWVDYESKHRISYIYIASMGDVNLKKFKQDLYKQKDKDGLIIDIRYNGGGHIHDELLNLLSRTAYGYSLERGDSEFTSLPAFKWEGPTVLLINEHCYSDAEIFPMGFKKLKIGTIVGMPTFGAVIGTSNLTLMDGTNFREPSEGWYRTTGKKLENNPVNPDVLVENSPEQDWKVPDNQLKEALRVIMKKLKSK